MDTYPINQSDAHYSQQRQPQWAPNHLLTSTHSHASQGPFPSPPASSIGEHGQHYPPFFSSGSQQSTSQSQSSQQQQQGSGNNGGGVASGGDQMSHNHLSRASSSLSLNLSALTVASPTNLSPIGPPSAGAAGALSPATPISPSTNPFNNHHHHGHHMSSQFQFSPPDSQGQNSNANQNSQNTPQNAFESDLGGTTPSASGSSASNYDVVPTRPRITTTTSRSSSSSTSSTSIAPSRKRSFTSQPPSATSTSGGGGTPLLEESSYDDSRQDTPMDLGFEDGDLRYSGPGTSSTPGAGGGSPVDGGSGSGGEEGMGSGTNGLGGLGPIGGLAGAVGGSLGMLGKPMATNNFVTKLYQMINDPKSAHFIAWTELGTSFVVSNVGEFSRSILGSHFKHNNFSSFVRQLNMYGFHKINRTPRAQRTSTDAQTWEFSHHKFLRGRPDLLDEIKRKALEPDPAMKHRVELPGEVAAQLGAMRDENRRMWDQLSGERRKVEKLVNVVTRLWDVVGKGFPGTMPQFPQDLLEPIESPNIYITSPTSNTPRYPPPLSMSLGSQPLHSLHSLSSPNSSPTAADFPSHILHSQHQHQHQQHHHPHHNQHQSHSLSRQHSFHHVSFSRSESSPLPGSPGEMSMDMFEDGPGDGENAPTGRPSTKRQRISNDDGSVMSLNGIVNGSGDQLSMSSPGTGVVGSSGMGSLSPPSGKKMSRARSDSAPLGYGMGMQGAWSAGPGTISGRPRSGSGMMPQHHHQQQQPRSFAIQNIGSMSRNNGTPLLSISTVPSNGGSINR